MKKDNKIIVTSNDDVKKIISYLKTLNPTIFNSNMKKRMKHLSFKQRIIYKVNKTHNKPMNSSSYCIHATSIRKDNFLFIPKVNRLTIANSSNTWYLYEFSITFRNGHNNINNLLYKCFNKDEEATAYYNNVLNDFEKIGSKEILGFILDYINKN